MKPILCVLLISAALQHLAADAPTPNVAMRGSLSNSRLHFEQEKTGRVAFIGGSITEMDGYRPMVCENLKKRFPQTAFTFVPAGIASTCSTTGAFRLASDVLAAGPIDLFFIEFAVNDDQDAAHTRAECIRGMEGLIRHALRQNPSMDIVITYFVNESMLQKLQNGETPLTIEAHDAVAAHYSISSLNLAKEAAERISAGTLTWKQYGGVHPATYGNAICAKMIEALFDQAWTAPLPAKDIPHPLPEKPLDPLNYEHGRFIDPSKAQLIHGWTLATPDWKSIPGSKRSRFEKIPVLSATEPGSELSLDFDGTAIGAYILAGPDAGVLEASIDAGPYSAVNLFHRFSAGLHYPRSIIFAADLKPGPHTLKLKVSPETKSTAHAARIMQFEAN